MILLWSVLITFVLVNAWMVVLVMLAPRIMRALMKRAVKPAVKKASVPYVETAAPTTNPR